MTDLFPEPLTRTAMPKIPAPFSALDALKCLAQESAVVAIAASDIALGVPISEADHARIASAAGLINAALEGVHGIA